MKTKLSFLQGLSIGLIFIIASFYNVAKAQVDTTKVAQPESTQQTQADSVKVTQPDSTLQEKGEENKKVDRKRRDEFILYAGINFNQLGVTESNYESPSAMGYHLGGYYKRGKFFYWQVGGRFSNALYSLDDLTTTEVSTIDFSVKSIDIPLTVGINFLSVTNRILALRIFASAVPAFNIGVGENDLEITKDDINSFIMYGQGGVGVNVAFLVIEAGYNYGLEDLMKDDIKSTPGQVFINLGFRF